MSFFELKTASGRPFEDHETRRRERARHWHDSCAKERAIVKQAFSHAAARSFRVCLEIVEWEGGWVKDAGIKAGRQQGVHASFSSSSPRRPHCSVAAPQAMRFPWPPRRSRSNVSSLLLSVVGVIMRRSEAGEQHACRSPLQVSHRERGKGGRGGGDLLCGKPCLIRVHAQNEVHPAPLCTTSQRQLFFSLSIP